MESKHAVYTPCSLDFADRVRSSFARQGIMTHMGAQLLRVLPGEVENSLSFRQELTQQHGFLHAGVITTIMDSACGYAALSLMPAGASVLTVEFKVNLLNPAKGAQFVARGMVVKSGRTLTVCSGEVLVVDSGNPQLIATMTATMILLQDRAGIAAG